MNTRMTILSPGGDRLSALAGSGPADLQSLGSGEQAGIGALRPALPKSPVLVSLVRGMKDPLYSGRTCSK